jgi:hypothetical protein
MILCIEIFKNSRKEINLYSIVLLAPQITFLFLVFLNIHDDVGNEAEYGHFSFHVSVEKGCAHYGLRAECTSHKLLLRLQAVLHISK